MLPATPLVRPPDLSTPHDGVSTWHCRVADGSSCDVEATSAYLARVVAARILGAEPTSITVRRA